MLTDLFAGLPRDILERLEEFRVDVSHEKAKGPIDELLSRTVLKGGKRLRPLLTYLMGKAFALELKSCDVLARSIEQVHAASLAHDDVIDDASLRRGEPSINIQGSNKLAVLAGDYLLANVIMQLCRETRLDVVNSMADVIQQLSQGEWVQWEAASQRSYSPDILEEIAQKKTASVMSWCCLAPAILANKDQQIQTMAFEFGHHMGIAFQQMDDTLDFAQTSQKDQGLDLANGQVNFVMYEWLCEKEERWESYRSGALLSEISEGADFGQACSLVEKRAQGHILQARKLLDELSNEFQEKQVQASLELMLDFLSNRSF